MPVVSSGSQGIDPGLDHINAGPLSVEPDWAGRGECRGDGGRGGRQDPITVK